MRLKKGDIRIGGIQGRGGGGVRKEGELFKRLLLIIKKEAKRLTQRGVNNSFCTKRQVILTKN